MGIFEKYQNCHKQHDIKADNLFFRRQFFKVTTINIYISLKVNISL